MHLQRDRTARWRQLCRCLPSSATTGRAKIPYNGSGSFSTVYNWQTDAANGLNISSSRMQTQDADFASGLSLCLTKDGQQQMAANLPMGGFTLANIANASAQKQPISVQDFQDGTPVLLGTVSGTDTITAAAPIAPAAYKKGQTWRFIAAGPNATTNVTLNANGLGPVNVTKLGALPLAIGDIQGGQVVDVTHDGTQFQIKTPNFSLAPASGSLINIQLITASGTYTKTAGATKALVWGQGAGGAGGGTPATSANPVSAGSGGTSGAFGILWIPSGLANQTVTIGAAGSPASGANGGNGGDTSFGSLMLCPGGTGGRLGFASGGAATGGDIGAVPSGPTALPSGTGNIIFAVPGCPGNPGINLQGPLAGNGGNSPWGTGGHGGANYNGWGPSSASAGYGAGGAGSAVIQNQAAAAGLAGTAGAVLVFEYA